MKKKLFLLLFTFSILFSSSPISASTMSENEDNKFPYYIESTISDVSFSSILPVVTMSQNANNTITKTKTTRVKAQDGTVLWSVSITATFVYNGTSAKCISCSHNALSYAQTWSIKSVSSTKNENSATATAIATHSNGGISQDFSQSVTIKCSKNGTIS